MTCGTNGRPPHRVRAYRIGRGPSQTEFNGEKQAFGEQAICNLQPYSSLHQFHCPQIARVKLVFVSSCMTCACAQAMVTTPWPNGQTPAVSQHQGTCARWQRKLRVQPRHGSPLCLCHITHCYLSCQHTHSRTVAAVTDHLQLPHSRPCWLSHLICLFAAKKLAKAAAEVRIWC